MIAVKQTPVDRVDQARFTWTVKPTNEQRKIVRKALTEASRALEESKKSNHPIVGYRPDYPATNL